MKIQLVISTMHRENHELLSQMNVQTDAVVINQCEKDSVESLDFEGHKITWVNTSTRGVGKSRNLGILYSSGDVLLFADDDLKYVDGYEKKAIQAFQEHKKADVIFFNFRSLNPKRPEPLINKDQKIRWTNCLKFGAFRIAIRRKALLRSNTFFSLLFGGGAEFSNGEDNVFVTALCRSGFRCFASKTELGSVAQLESTWFSGKNEKFYHDRGALMRMMYGKNAPAISFLYELLKNHDPKMSLKRRLKLVRLGISDFDDENW